MSSSDALLRVEPDRAALRPGRGVPVVLVVNATASGAPSAHERERLVTALRHAGSTVDLQITRSLADLAAVWSRDDGRRVVLVGGDGSIHAVAGLPGPPRDIALIPAGRANNIARSLGIPLDHAAAAELAAYGRVQPIDLIEARAPSGRHVVVEGVSAGVLALARARYRGRNSADLRAAARAGVHALEHFHPFAVHVSDGPDEEDLRLAQLFVANLPLYAFGLHVAPGADPVDSTLDLVGIAADTRRAVLRRFLALRRGGREDPAAVHRWRAPAIRLTTSGCSPVIADSTDLGPGPVELRVLPLALRIVRP